MSSEEQDAIILRLVKERREAKRACALLDYEVEAASDEFSKLAMLLRQPAPENLSKAVALLDELAAAGGLDRLKASLNDYRASSIKVSELSRTLEKAGLE